MGYFYLHAVHALVRLSLWGLFQLRFVRILLRVPKHVFDMKILHWSGKFLCAFSAIVKHSMFNVILTDIAPVVTKYAQTPL